MNTHTHGPQRLVELENVIVRGAHRGDGSVVLAFETLGRKWKVTKVNITKRQWEYLKLSVETNEVLT